MQVFIITFYYGDPSKEEYDSPGVYIAICDTKEEAKAMFRKEFGKDSVISDTQPAQSGVVTMPSYLFG